MRKETSFKKVDVFIKKNKTDECSNTNTLFQLKSDYAKEK